MLEPARFFKEARVASRSLGEALRSEASKTREDRKKRKFFGSAAKRNRRATPAKASRSLQEAKGDRPKSSVCPLEVERKCIVTQFEARVLKQLLEPWRCV